MIGVAGAAAALPFEPHGADISEQLEANRSRILGGDYIVNLDGNPHSNMRLLVKRLFTPSRLKANQEFVAAYSEELVISGTAAASARRHPQRASRMLVSGRHPAAARRSRWPVKGTVYIRRGAGYER